MGNESVMTDACRCAVAVPVVKAERKGAARTVCGRCGLPVRIEFGSR